jgi:hypothetical protein
MIKTFGKGAAQYNAFRRDLGLPPLSHPCTSFWICCPETPNCAAKTRCVLPGFVRSAKTSTLLAQPTRRGALASARRLVAKWRGHRSPIATRTRDRRSAASRAARASTPGRACSMSAASNCEPKGGGARVTTCRPNRSFLVTPRWQPAWQLARRLTQPVVTSPHVLQRSAVHTKGPLPRALPDLLDFIGRGERI